MEIRTWCQPHMMGKENIGHIHPPPGATKSKRAHTQVESCSSPVTPASQYKRSKTESHVQNKVTPRASGLAALVSNDAWGAPPTQPDQPTMPAAFEVIDLTADDLPSPERLHHHPPTSTQMITSPVNEPPKGLADNTPIYAETAAYAVARTRTVQPEVPSPLTDQQTPPTPIIQAPNLIQPGEKIWHDRAANTSVLQIGEPIQQTYLKVVQQCPYATTSPTTEGRATTTPAVEDVGNRCQSQVDIHDLMKETMKVSRTCDIPLMKEVISHIKAWRLELNAAYVKMSFAHRDRWGTRAELRQLQTTATILRAIIQLRTKKSQRDFLALHTPTSFKGKPNFVPCSHPQHHGMAPPTIAGSNGHSSWSLEDIEKVEDQIAEVVATGDLNAIRVVQCHLRARITDLNIEISKTRKKDLGLNDVHIELRVFERVSLDLDAVYRRLNVDMIDRGSVPHAQSIASTAPRLPPQVDERRMILGPLVQPAPKERRAPSDIELTRSSSGTATTPAFKGRAVAPPIVSGSKGQIRLEGQIKEMQDQIQQVAASGDLNSIRVFQSHLQTRLADLYAKAYAMPRDDPQLYGIQLEFQGLQNASLMLDAKSRSLNVDMVERGSVPNTQPVMSNPPPPPPPQDIAEQRRILDPVLQPVQKKKRKSQVNKEVTAKQHRFDSLAMDLTMPGRQAHLPRLPEREEVVAPLVEPILCEEQRNLVNLICSGRNVFYTGSAGCGKSTVLKAFVRSLKDIGKNVKIIAPTGRAALDIGGSTFWTYAGWTPLHMKKPLEELLKAAHGKWVRTRLTETDVLVIDEVSMIENQHFERLNALLKEARGSSEPFGGVQMVVTGDFCQLPPVKPFAYCITCGREMFRRPDDSYKCPSHGEYKDEEKWTFRSDAWDECNFEHVCLRTIHRQSDRVFINILEKCRMGKGLTSGETNILLNHPTDFKNAVKLFSTREEVRRVNQAEFERLKTKKKSFTCHDSFATLNRLPEWLLQKYIAKNPDGSLAQLRDHKFEAEIELKQGMLVVLLVNLDIAEGLVNGSQGKLVGWEKYDPKKLPKAKIRDTDRKSAPIDPQAAYISGDHAAYREGCIRSFAEKMTDKHWPVVMFDNGRQRTIYADCTAHEVGDEKPPNLLSRTQVPLLPAWAMSIHKSQGMTLNKVTVDLSRSFEEGQMYVALSRARSLEGLKVEHLGDWGRKGNPQVMEFLFERFGIK